MDEVKYLDMDGLVYLWGRIKSMFMQKDGNKVLSDNNYTDEAKARVATVSAIPDSEIDRIFDS